MELFKRCEWWEILGLLYCTFENSVLEQKAIEEQKRESEVKQKVQDGKMNLYFKQGLSESSKKRILGEK